MSHSFLWFLAYAVVGFLVFNQALSVDIKDKEYHLPACVVVGLCWPVVVVATVFAFIAKVIKAAVER